MKKFLFPFLWVARMFLLVKNYWTVGTVSKILASCCQMHQCKLLVCDLLSQWKLIISMEGLFSGAILLLLRRKQILAREHCRKKKCRCYIVMLLFIFIYFFIISWCQLCDKWVAILNLTFKQYVYSAASDPAKGRVYGSKILSSLYWRHIFNKQYYFRGLHARNPQSTYQRRYSHTKVFSSVMLLYF